MNNQPQPLREQVALREIGRTEVSRSIAFFLTVLFLASLAAVPILQVAGSDSADATGIALEVLPETGRTLKQDGVLAANRTLLEGIDRFEETLEEESLLRKLLQAPTQRLLTEGLGVGNEQVILGRDGWLVLRDDFEHVVGRGFLDPDRLRRERLESARLADPLPAILAFQRDLAARGIELVIMPTPVKPTVHPELLTAFADSGAPMQNASYDLFVDRLRAAGVTVFDPTAVLADAKDRGGDPLYLRTDTHWTPRAMELVAHELAAAVEALVDWREPGSEDLVRRSSTVNGSGDLVRLLEYPSENDALSSETAQISRVLTRRGAPWAADRDAEILLLGDSFTNIYSDPSLGWGTGAGLAEQLAYALGRPVDRIALNAGGAWSSRQALARSSATGTDADRLSGKRIVVYQFATRELSTGDWKLLPIHGAPTGPPT